VELADISEEPSYVNAVIISGKSLNYRYLLKEVNYSSLFRVCLHQVRGAHLFTKFPVMKPRGSLLLSQKPATGAYTESD
jgi:hypothetical protein